MDDLPCTLRQARESRGLTRAELAERTKLKEHYIAALENGELEKLPNPVYARAFLRLCAREVGLNPTELLSSYDTLAVADQPTMDMRTTVDSHNTNLGMWRWVFVAGLLATVFLGRMLMPTHSLAPAQPNTRLDVPEPSTQVPLIIPEGMTDADADTSGAIPEPAAQPAPVTVQAPREPSAPPKPVQVTKTTPLIKPAPVNAPTPEVKSEPAQVAPQVANTPPVTKPEAPQEEKTPVLTPQETSTVVSTSPPTNGPASQATPAVEEATNNTNETPVIDGTAVFYPGRTGGNPTGTNP